MFILTQHSIEFAPQHVFQSRKTISGWTKKFGLFILTNMAVLISLVSSSWRRRSLGAWTRVEILTELFDV